jgi:hypothetical protein
MGPGIIVLALAAAGGWLLLKPSGAALPKPSEAPADADGLLASALAPSLTDVSALQQFYVTLATAVNNLQGAAAQRVALYALVCFLKACMLAKGAQPNANELLAIARAPLAGGAGLVSYGDAGIDQMTAAATALASTMADVGAIGTYISAIAAVPSSTPRLRAYLLALKAKQMALRNAVGFSDAQNMPAKIPQVFFAIANLPATSVPANSANSILVYQ